MNAFLILYAVSVLIVAIVNTINYEVYEKEFRKKLEAKVRQQGYGEIVESRFPVVAVLNLLFWSLVPVLNTGVAVLEILFIYKRGRIRV